MLREVCGNNQPANNRMQVTPYSEVFIEVGFATLGES